MKEITLFVDKVEPNDLGGMTKDKRKAEYILAVYRLSFEKLLKMSSPKAKLPSGAIQIDRFILLYNISWDLENINFGLFHHKIDIEKYFNVFADNLPPKVIQGFHTLKQKIIKMDKSELNKIVLSDNQSDFIQAYGNYIEHR